MNWLQQLLLPIQASTQAQSVDTLFLFLVWLSVFFFLLITGLVVYCVVKFRRRSANDVTPYITHHTGLELTWSIIPLIICIFIFFWGFHGYLNAFTAPGDALEVMVTGKKWLWSFEYPNGTRTINEFHVPIGKPVRLIMGSEDVIHNFFIPSMRIKHDVVPGRYTEMWFEATEPGTHIVECAMYCGKSHSDMLAKLVVDTQEKYQQWLDNGGMDEDDPNMTPAKRGERLYQNKGCNACHSLDGTRGQGPSWKGIWGQTHTMTDGSKWKVDENYVRISVYEPQRMIVQGFEGIMPSFQGLLSEKDVQGIIAFIKEQK